MGPFDVYGMGESQAREYLERELGKNASTTSFYWESEELEEALDLIIEAVSQLIAANNAALTQQIRGNILKDADARGLGFPGV